jgi:photosystem II stability/assembly factor-like uncharacterized protein
MLNDRLSPGNCKEHTMRRILSQLFAAALLASAAFGQGSAWVLQSPGTTNWQINDMAFTSPDRGYFCGTNEELWETTDRGRTWTNRIRYAGFGIDGNQFYSMGFFDAQRGFLISNAEQPARYTTDGGQTWRFASGAAPYGREFFDVLSPTQAFLGGPQFSTLNAGASWTMHPWPADLGRIFSFDMRDAQVGLMASETYNPPIVAGTYRTANGGQSWVRIADWGQVLWLADGTALNARPYPTDPWPLERGARVYRSTDAGLTWDLIADHVAPGFLDQQQGFWAWCALDATTICGVTLSGKVWRSTDAGVNWTLTQPTDLIRGSVPDTAMGIRAFGSQVWIFGEKGIVMRSDDAGLTWSYPASGIGHDVSEIRMRDERVGLALAKGFILRTVNGGQTWTPTRLNIEGIDDLLPPDTDFIEGYTNIAWADANTVFVQGVAANCCAGRLIMWKSTDAGLTWQYVYNLQHTVRVFAFDCAEFLWIDPNIGYMLGFDVDPFGVGPSGYKTTDGGLTWTGIDSLLQSAVYEADFVDASRGWIQFTQTDTAYTTNGGNSWTVVPVPGNGLNDLDMFNASIGYAVGVLGETYKTTNGGRSWSLLPRMSEAEDYYEVKAISATEAILVGRDNTDLTRLRFFVRRTTNGGITWTRDNLPDQWSDRFLHAYHLDALAGNKIWVAGWGGYIASNTLPPCPADFDDGTGTGTPDGGVTIDDLLYYLAVYEAGTPRADVDNGTSTGTPDGGVTIDDLLYYLLRYEAGC